MAEPIEKLALRVEPGEAGERLDLFLARRDARFSRSRLKALIKDGHVSQAGQPLTDPNRRMSAGETVELVVPPAEAAAPAAEEIPLHILFEDSDLVVIDKPAGLVVHPGAGNSSGTLVNALIAHCGASLSGVGGVKRPGIVHRLDKDTSGLLVVAKTDVAHEGLAAQFARHSIDRRYLAIIAGVPVPASGKVDAPLARSSANRKKMAIVGEGRGKRAVTRYRIVSPLRDAALTECRLETGRTHQVRVHMASIGHPLLGDPVYGRARPAHREILKELNFHRQALHAAELGFEHPVSKQDLSFKSPLPSDIQELFGALTV
jgi:23S rRNA pseudouridine1911/1915/1917 synthase